MAKAALFDLDGVLVQTEELKASAHDRVIAQLGGQIPAKSYQNVLGQSFQAVARSLLQQAGLDVDLDRYETLFEHAYLTLVRKGVEPTPGIRELLTVLDRDG